MVHEVILHLGIRCKYPEQVKTVENLVGHAKKKKNMTPSLDFFDP